MVLEGYAKLIEDSEPIVKKKVRKGLEVAVDLFELRDDEKEYFVDYYLSKGYDVELRPVFLAPPSNISDVPHVHAFIIKEDK